MRLFSKGVISFLLLLCIAAVICGGLGYMAIWKKNINPTYSDESLIILTNSSYDDVIQLLKEKNVLLNYTTFDFVAGLMKYKKNEVPSGKYPIDPTWNNRQLIRYLRSGNQIPVKITFNNIRYPAELAGAIAKYIEPDSTEIMAILGDSTMMASYGYTNEDLLTLFIPNTYQLYWNTSPEALIKRMKKEHDAFWNVPWRIDSLKITGLTKKEVYTLASIVEKETRYNPEKPRVAGVYLNRIKTGMKLEADPTVVYAVGDFSIRRVLFKHLRHVSPYNTYLNHGLPPGPICMPSIPSIDAVLKAEDHDFIFFCAKPGYKGEHNFAKTNREHTNNANVYRAWLNSEKIKK